MDLDLKFLFYQYLVDHLDYYEINMGLPPNKLYILVHLF